MSRSLQGLPARRRPQLPLRAGGLALLLLSSACTELKDSDDPWTCLNEPPPMVPVMDPAPQRVLYTFAVVDAFGTPTVPIAGLEVRICVGGDEACTTPAGMAFQPSPEDLRGWAVVTQYGIEAYLRITAPDFIDTEYYFGAPLIGTPNGAMSPDGTMPWIDGEFVTPIRTSAADAFALGVGQLTRDPAKGIVALRTIGCDGERAAGVTLEMDPPTGQPYTLVSTNLPVPGGPAAPTDSRAVAGFVEIDPINARFTGIAPTGQRYGTTAFRVRANQLTVAEIRPFSGAYGR